MSELEARFRISVDGKDELAAFFRGGEQGVNQFRRNTKSALESVSQDINRFVSSAAKALGTLAGIGGGLGLGQQAKGVLELRDAVAGVIATAGQGVDKIDGLKATILSTAKATNQLGMDLTEALNVFVAKTGDIDRGTKALELFGRVATATRASAAEVAAVGADLSKLGITDQKQAFAILAKQSDEGSVELKDFVSQGPRLLSAAAGAGLKGEKGLREISALAQVYNKGTGNVERTSTSVEATFRDIAEKSDYLEARYGIKDVFKRDRVDVLREIMAKTKGNEEELRRRPGMGGIFGDEAMRGINVLRTELQNDGKLTSLDQFQNVKADSSLIDSKYAVNTSTGLAKIKASEIAIQAASDRNLGGIAERAAGSSGLVAQGYDLVTSHPALAATGALGALLAYKGVKGFLAGGGGAGGAAGAAGNVAGALGGGALPVTVTNWPAQLGGSGEGGGAADAVAAVKGKGGALAKIGNTVRTIGNNLPLLGTVLAGSYSLGQWADESLGLSDKLSSYLYRDTGAAALQAQSTSADEAAISATVKARAEDRRLRISMLENGGMEHGQAVYAADHPDIVNQVHIEINGDTVTLRDSGKSTRSQATMSRRTTGGSD